MSDYKTIKELVIDSYLSAGEMPSYEFLTEKVRKYFPSSKWQNTHYSWYKSQINTGRLNISQENSSQVLAEEQIEESISQSIDTQVSLERDLQQYFTSHINEIEKGLVLVEGGVEYKVEAGRIDLLARDVSNNYVVIELKAGKGKDASLGQLLGYIGCFSDKHENVRGILVASDFEPRVVFATKGLANIKLIQYKLSFGLSEKT